MSSSGGLRIAISGLSGCGNTSVSRELAGRLGLECVNYTFRSIARDDGITFDEVTKLAEERDDYDLRVDRIQVELARREPSVLGSRLAIWKLDDADLKVYLTGSPEVRARRILQREGGSVKNQMMATCARDERDRSRYLRIYGIDTRDYGFADLVVNTDRLGVAQVVTIIETAAREIGGREV